MLELTAVFESWHIGDGNYPPFHVGMLVNLAFQLHPASIKLARFRKEFIFTHRSNAEYDFRGAVIHNYTSRENLAVVDTGNFRFYIENPKIKKLKQGMWVKGKGTLLLDYYIWTEFLHRRTDPPNIFYSLEVTRIRKVSIPARFIQRQEKYKSYPTWLPGDKSGEISDLETMEGQRFEEEFYLVDFKESNREDLPKTFLE